MGKYALGNANDRYTFSGTPVVNSLCIMRYPAGIDF
jgi:hypothetical protein